MNIFQTITFKKLSHTFKQHFLNTLLEWKMYNIHFYYKRLNRCCFAAGGHHNGAFGGSFVASSKYSAGGHGDSSSGGGLGGLGGYSVSEHHGTGFADHYSDVLGASDSGYEALGSGSISGGHEGLANYH